MPYSLSTRTAYWRHNISLDLLEDGLMRPPCRAPACAARSLTCKEREKKELRSGLQIWTIIGYSRRPSHISSFMAHPIGSSMAVAAGFLYWEVKNQHRSAHIRC